MQANRETGLLGGWHFPAGRFQLRGGREAGGVWGGGEGEEGGGGEKEEE